MWGLTPTRYKELATLLITSMQSRQLLVFPMQGVVEASPCFWKNYFQKKERKQVYSYFLPCYYDKTSKESVLIENIKKSKLYAFSMLKMHFKYTF